MKKIFQENSTYTKVENEVIKKINNNPMEFIESDLISYSKKINCSKSAIQRLVKILNFDSLQQMKQHIHQELIFNKLFFDVNDNSSTKDRINNLKIYNNFSINKTIDSIDYQELNKIIKKINSSKQILVFGVGSSYLASTELANNILKLGFSINASSDIHNTLLTISSFTKNDLLILFTKSGQTKEIKFFQENLNKFPFDILVITSNKDFAKNFTYKIIHIDMEKKERLIATSSKISQLIISDIIFYELFYQFKNNKKIIEKNNLFIDKWNEKNKE